ncbi:MAG TPA: RNA polymerase factor sigma-54 [Desulfohalobiaceae bacterium]|nr:RNA polymerase factor sigma-54 [Desulfohalobiaceae bacterium]
MSIQLRQNLKLSQQLVMTPQLQQAIKLLQLSRLELVQTVQEALMENPILEERQDQVDNQEEQEPQTEKKEQFQEVNINENSLLRNAEWDDYIGNFSSSSRQAGEREIPEETNSLESMYAAKPSLESHLSWQLHLSALSNHQKEIGQIIIGNLDSDGYLPLSAQELSETYGYDIQDLEEVVRRIQFFDPVGISSRDFRECLKVQLEFLGEEDDILYQLIEKHLPDIENCYFQKILEKYNISREYLDEYIGVIKNLDPRPGASLNSGETFYVSPDAYIYKYDGEFIIILNDDGFPDIQINPFYLEALNEKKSQYKHFVKEKTREAMWLIKSLQQRQRTLYKTLESIVNYQRDFFEKGVSYLRPLVLKDVAEDIEVHESTVSRITTNKYISTPFGIFELKFFFNSGLGIDGGGQVASETVKTAIKRLIAEEDPQNPLSDKRLTEILHEQLQVNIARRTIAKYREALNIQSSTKRKKMER